MYKIGQIERVEIMEEISGYKDVLIPMYECRTEVGLWKLKLRDYYSGHTLSGCAEFFLGNGVRRVVSVNLTPSEASDLEERLNGVNP